MEEQYYFLKRLAAFCRGTSVWIVDSHDGPTLVDLGDLIDDYCDWCNDNGEFVLSTNVAEILGMDPSQRFNHKCAGMLGVNSNLASCTVLHGINLSFITGGVTSNSCVGDDAIGVVQLQYNEPDPEEGEIAEFQSVSKVIKGLQVIGRIAPEKTRFLYPSYQEPQWDSCRWTYLKRWLERYDQELVIGTLINLPPFAFLQRELETDRKMRWDVNSEAELLPRLSAQIFGCMKALHSFFYDDMDRGQYQEVYEYLGEFYKAFKLPRDGWVFAEIGQGGYQSFRLRHVSCVPAIGRSLEEFQEIIKVDPMSYLLRSVLERDERMYFDIPRVVIGDWCEGLNKDSVVSTMTAALSLSRKLGYSERKSQLESVGRDMFVSSFKRFLDVKTSVVYEWTLCPMPDWLFNLL
jgi:hypothetical protein